MDYMENEEKKELTLEEQLDIIEKSNNSLMKYFNDTFLNQLEDIQALKTEIFEINVKIEEFNKTKDLYSYKSSSKRNAFSPALSDSQTDERNIIIDENIRSLADQRDLLYQKLRTLDYSLNSLKEHITHINDARDAIASLKTTLCEDDTFGFDFVQSEDNSDISSHGYNILMQQAFKNAYLNTVLDKDIKDSIIGINSKLDIVSKLMTADTTRAKLTLKEVMHSSKEMISSIDSIRDKIEIDIDSSTPLYTLVDDYIMKVRDEHPECIIEADTQFVNEDVELHPVFVINTMKLINIFFNNIFTHSEATKVEFTISLSENSLQVKITDNGIGINPDYLTTSPWYSSLHKAHEIIYLLGGTLNILGSVIGGTDIVFSYPIKL